MATTRLCPFCCCLYVAGFLFLFVCFIQRVQRYCDTMLVSTAASLRENIITACGLQGFLLLLGMESGTQSELVQLIPSSLAVVIVTFVFYKHPLPCESHEVVHFPLKTLFRCCGVCLYKKKLKVVHSLKFIFWYNVIIARVPRASRFFLLPHAFMSYHPCIHPVAVTTS